MSIDSSRRDSLRLAPTRNSGDGAPLTDHVLLVSIDGLRAQLYRDERWPAPVLHELARRGAIALAVRTVFPALTYPAHATLVTGALPARHGIVDNEPFEPVARTGRWIWEASAIRSRTLWDAVRARGGTTAAISWPVTVGADIDGMCLTSGGRMISPRSRPFAPRPRRQGCSKNFSAASEGPGAGATFTGALPLKVETTESIALPQRQVSNSIEALLSGVRVLVIDDQHDERATLSTVFQQYGAETIAADSATAALTCSHVLVPM